MPLQITANDGGLHQQSQLGERERALLDKVRDSGGYERPPWSIQEAGCCIFLSNFFCLQYIDKCCTLSFSLALGYCGCMFGRGENITEKINPWQVSWKSLGTLLQEEAPWRLGDLLLVLPGARGGPGASALLMVLLHPAQCRNCSAQLRKTWRGKPEKSLA